MRINLFSLFILTRIYVKILLQKRIFIFLFTALSVLGIILIPNSDANYVTFYMGKNAITSNKYWIAPFAGVMSNVILFPIIIFTVINDKIKEEKKLISTISNLSSNSQFTINLYKILGLFILWFLLLLVFNFTISITNFRNYDFWYSFFYLIYYNVSFIFFSCAFAYFIEFLLNKNWQKFSLYFIFYLIIILNDNHFFNLLGLHELYLYVSEITETSNYFAIGYLNKESVDKTLEFTYNLKPKFIFFKVFTILFVILSIFILSKLKRRIYNFQYINFLEDKTKENIVIQKTYKPAIKSISKNKTITQLFLKDIFLLSSLISNKSKISVFFLWVLCVFIPTKYQYFSISLLFLCLVFLNQFIYRLHSDANCIYYEKISIYTQNQLFVSKTLTIFFIYIIALFPLFIHFSAPHNLYTILNFCVLAITIVISSRVFKSSLFIDVLYVIIFSSTLTNSPIINIFNL